MSVWQGHTLARRRRVALTFKEDSNVWISIVLPTTGAQVKRKYHGFILSISKHKIHYEMASDDAHDKMLEEWQRCLMGGRSAILWASFSLKHCMQYSNNGLMDPHA